MVNILVDEAKKMADSLTQGAGRWWSWYEEDYSCVFSHKDFYFRPFNKWFANNGFEK